ncbi:MAG TPA: TolC family protein, partial [Bryobacteraceae bacterium]|nr:TolC family protein [Bryobacteraceae bacterium]
LGYGWLMRATYCIIAIGAAAVGLFVIETVWVRELASIGVALASGVAFLDLAAAGDQVAVAKSSVQLAARQLTHAENRFSAGVTTNIEVVQAQEAVATANENYIASLHQYNLAKASLARALGGAEELVKHFLGTK